MMPTDFNHAMRIPGTVHLSFIPSDSRRIFEDNSMPVCLLERKKWIQPMMLSKAMLLDAVMLSSPIRGTAAVELKNRFHEFGQFLYGKDYLGCMVRSYHEQYQSYRVSYVCYKWSLNHDESCTQDHKIVEEHKANFTRMDIPYWFVDQELLMAGL